MGKNTRGVPEGLAMILYDPDNRTPDDYEMLFELYKQWKSMPSYFRGKPASQLIDFGIRDEVALFIMQIRDQNDFADTLRVNRNTPTNWNKRLDAENWKPEWKKWAQALTPNVVGALFANIVGRGGGKGADVKVWMETVEDQASIVKVIDAQREKELMEELAKYASDRGSIKGPDTGKPARQGEA